MPGTGEWGTPLFSCLQDTNQCIDTALCAPCAMSRQLSALFGHSNEMNVFRLIHGCFFPLCTNIRIRWRTVVKYGIDEPFHLTIAMAWCCGGCSLCQTHRELTLRNVWPGGTILHKEPTDYAQMK